jgi:hypothetical protein
MQKESLMFFKPTRGTQIQVIVPQEPCYPGYVPRGRIHCLHYCFYFAKGQPDFYNVPPHLGLQSLVGFRRVVIAILCCSSRCLNSNAALILLRCWEDLYKSQGTHTVLISPLYSYCQLPCSSQSHSLLLDYSPMLGDDKIDGCDVICGISLVSITIPNWLMWRLE